MPFTAVTRNPSLLEIAICDIDPDLSPVLTVARKFEQQSEQPFGFYVTGGVARKIALKHFLDPAISALYPTPSDLDFTWIRSEIPEQETLDFKPKTEAFFKEFCKALSQELPTVQFTLEITKAWMLIKGITRSGKSVDIALSYGKIADTLTCSIRMLVTSTGNIVFQSQESFQQFQALEIESKEIGRLINSTLDLENLKQPLNSIRLRQYTYPGGQEDLRHFEKEIGILYKRKKCLGQLLYSIHGMMVCGFRLEPLLTQVFKDVLKDQKKIDAVFSAYTLTASKKKYKQAQSLQDLLFLNPIATTAASATPAEVTIPSPTRSEETSSSSAVSSPHELDRSSADLSDPERGTAVIQQPQPPQPPPVPTTYLNALVRPQSTAVVPVTEQPQLSPQQRLHDTPVLAPAPVSKAKRKTATPPACASNSSVITPPCNVPVTKGKGVSPDITPTTRPKPAAGVTPDKPRVQAGGESTQQGSKPKTAPPLSPPHFTGDLRTFVDELQIFLSACQKLENKLAQNHLLITTIGSIHAAMHAPYTDKPAEDTLAQFSSLLSHSLWAYHKIQINPKKFLDQWNPPAIRPTQKVPIITPTHESPMAAQKVASAPSEQGQARMPSKANGTEEGSPGLPAPAPALFDIVPLPPLPESVAPGGVLNIFKSSWASFGLLSSLGCLLVKYDQISAPQMVVALGLLGATSQIMEYMYKSRAQFAFEQEKVLFNASSSWDDEQFMKMLAIWRDTDRTNERLLIGKEDKLIFLRKIITIHKVLAKKFPKIDLFDHSAAILNAIKHCYGSLEAASKASYVFLGEPASTQGEGSTIQQRREINNYFVKDKRASDEQMAYIEKLGKLASMSSQIVLFYTTAYHQIEIRVQSTVTTQGGVHVQYVKGNAVLAEASVSYPSSLGHKSLLA